MATNLMAEGPRRAHHERCDRHLNRGTAEKIAARTAAIAAITVAKKNDLVPTGLMRLFPVEPRNSVLPL
jgi:hypothetical protein